MRLCAALALAIFAIRVVEAEAQARGERFFEQAQELSINAARIAKRVRIGDQLQFAFTLQSTASRAQDLIVDYSVHFVKANGSSRPKVFKLKRVTLAARGSVELAGRVSFASMTTRQHYPGRHHIEVLANGEAYPLGEFELRE